MAALGACFLSLSRNSTCGCTLPLTGRPHLGLPLAVAALAAVGPCRPSRWQVALSSVVGADGTVADCEGIAAGAIEALAHDLALMCPDGHAEVAERGTVYRVGSCWRPSHFRGNAAGVPGLRDWQKPQERGRRNVNRCRFGSDRPTPKRLAALAASAFRVPAVAPRREDMALVALFCGVGGPASWTRSTLRSDQ